MAAPIVDKRGLNAGQRDMLKQTHGNSDIRGQWYHAEKTITVHLDQHTNMYGLRTIITTNPYIIFVVHKNGAGDYMCALIDADNVIWR